MKLWIPLAISVLSLTVSEAPAIAQAATARMSVSTGGSEGNAGSFSSSISSDGRYVAFDSQASNLVPNDTNTSSDVFVRDTWAGTVKRVSLANDGSQANSDSYNSAISADGRYVAFESFASNLVVGDTNGSWDVFVRDTVANTTQRVSVGTGGAQSNGDSFSSAISADGKYVTFFSDASNLVLNDSNAVRDVFVRDTVAGTTKIVSVATDGSQGNGDSNYSTISADGRYIAFDSDASNLVLGDTNGSADSFVRDMIANTTKRVSVGNDGSQGNGGSGYGPSISADGRYVVFFSDASNLIAGDANGQTDVFIRDTVASTTKLVSVAFDGAQGNGWSTFASVSADGRYVAFASYAANLVTADANATWDIFVRDTVSLTTKRVSLTNTGTEGDGFSHYGLSISADARYVAFESNAGNLVIGDTNVVRDVFVRGPLIGTGPYTVEDVANALRLAGGHQKATAADITRVNVVPDGTSAGRIDLRDAVLIGRKAAGLDTNP